MEAEPHPAFWIIESSTDDPLWPYENSTEIMTQEEAGIADPEKFWDPEKIGLMVVEGLGTGGITATIYKICRMLPEPKWIIWLFRRRKKKKEEKDTTAQG